jgi:hypothetical protein
LSCQCQPYDDAPRDNPTNKLAGVHPQHPARSTSFESRKSPSHSRRLDSSSVNCKHGAITNILQSKGAKILNLPPGNPTATLLCFRPTLKSLPKHPTLVTASYFRPQPRQLWLHFKALSPTSDSERTHHYRAPLLKIEFRQVTEASHPIPTAFRPLRSRKRGRAVGAVYIAQSPLLLLQYS